MTDTVAEAGSNNWFVTYTLLPSGVTATPTGRDGPDGVIVAVTILLAVSMTATLVEPHVGDIDLVAVRGHRHVDWLDTYGSGPAGAERSIR
jgi:hypothetical protein